MNKPAVYLKIKRDRFPFLLLITLFLIVISLACNVPIQSFFSPNANEKGQSSDQVYEGISKTLTARPPQGQSDSNNGSEEKSPSDTPTITPSPTITLTPTPDKAAAFISENTNCREGDKEVYGLVHTFLAGDWVDLVGKNREDTYWYVKDQQGGYTECWLWKKFATPEGNTESLPVIIPPPTPTPVVAFVITNKGTSGNKILVKIQNTGNITLQSYTATFKDTIAPETVSQTSNQFGAAVSIPIGKNSTVTSGSFCSSPVGHKMKVTIKACTDDSLGGWCSTSVAEFKAK